MIQSTGGEWTVEDLNATGRLYQLRFCPEADQGLWCLPSRGRRSARTPQGAARRASTIKVAKALPVTA